MERGDTRCPCMHVLGRHVDPPPLLKGFATFENVSNVAAGQNVAITSPAGPNLDTTTEEYNKRHNFFLRCHRCRTFIYMKGKKGQTLKRGESQRGQAEGSLSLSLSFISLPFSLSPILLSSRCF